jgi:D-3-phosphoglycerate dehydrogenase / 2-oxoglutarate reductase
MTDPVSSSSANLVGSAEGNQSREVGGAKRSELPATGLPVAGLKVALVDLDGKIVPAWVPESLSRAGIQLVVGDSKTRDDLARYAGDAEVIWLLGGSRILQNGNLGAVPRCWAIVRTGSGTDNVPLEEATRQGIVVANTPGAFSDAVSDHVIALLFAAMRRITALDRRVRAGEWSQAAGEPINSLQGRTLGLVGFGHVARELARKLSGFSLNVLAHDPFVVDDVIRSFGAQPAALPSVLAQSDFVSLHCSLTAETKHLIGEAELRSMKSSAVLINTSRGAVVDEGALVRALSEGWIAAAALDVVENEPPKPDSPLLQLENVVLTPHVAGLSAHGFEPRWRLSVETVIALAQRHWPASTVNPTVRPKVNLSS